MPHRVRGHDAAKTYARFRIIASRLHGPPPAQARYRQEKQNRIAALPPFTSGMKARAENAR